MLVELERVCILCRKDFTVVTVEDAIISRFSTGLTGTCNECFMLSAPRVSVFENQIHDGQNV